MPRPQQESSFRTTTPRPFMKSGSSRPIKPSIYEDDATSDGVLKPFSFQNYQENVRNM